MTEKATLTKPPQRIESSLPATPADAPYLEESETTITCLNCCTNSDGTCCPLKCLEYCKLSKKPTKLRGNEDAAKPSSHSLDAINFGNMFKEPANYYARRPRTASPTRVPPPQDITVEWDRFLVRNTNTNIAVEQNEHIVVEPTEHSEELIDDENTKQLQEPNQKSCLMSCCPLKHICRKPIRLKCPCKTKLNTRKPDVIEEGEVDLRKTKRWFRSFHYNKQPQRSIQKKEQMVFIFLSKLLSIIIFVMHFL